MSFKSRASLAGPTVGGVKFPTTGDIDEVAQTQSSSQNNRTELVSEIERIKRVVARLQRLQSKLQMQLGTYKSTDSGFRLQTDNQLPGNHKILLVDTLSNTSRSGFAAAQQQHTVRTESLERILGDKAEAYFRQVELTLSNTTSRPRGFPLSKTRSPDSIV